jgi:predicted MPP superfamily phosphohydrolase
MALRFLRHRRLKWLLPALLVAVVFVTIDAFWFEPDSLLVVDHALDLPGWPRTLDGFRIAAVGDVHAGAPFIDEAKLEDIVRRIDAANPDLIVWLGDYVIQGVAGGKFMEPEKVARILSSARARHGQVAVIGNHDRWLDPARVERAFLTAGIPFLRWGSIEIAVNGERIHVYGLDDFELSPNYWVNFRATRAKWDDIPATEPILVLSHSPDVFPSLPSRVALTLASHTHGGQVRLPLLGSLIVPSSFGQRYARGFIVEEGRRLFVNTGIGTSIIPVRFGVPPEISILTLRAPATGHAP